MFTPRTLEAHPTGASMPTMSKTESVARHLILLRNENNPTQDRLYVNLAAEYEMTPAEIAHWSALPVERVREILGGD